MITDNFEQIEDLMNTEIKDKKAEFHRNLKIGFTILGIIVFGMSAIINYHTIKKLSK